MIKRLFYKEEHGESASSSSSGSDSDPDPVEEEAEEDVEEQETNERGEEHDEEEAEEEQEGHEQEEGYQSEDSSREEVDEASIGLLVADGERESPQRDETNHKYSPPVNIGSTEKASNADAAKSAPNLDDPVEIDFANWILKCKSVFKCKLCPRIICLNEEIVRVHLTSKRHARSKKLLGEGRLKLMLNSDGELEEDQETHAERHARTLALAQQVKKSSKDSGRQRQSRRRKKRSRHHPEKNEQQVDSSKKKKRKTGE